MSGDSKKTIQINPELFSINNRNLRKTKKIREKKQKPKPVIRPNTLRRTLLNKIKLYQTNEKEKSANVKENTNNKFNDEFNNSLNYLQELSKQKKQEKREKKNKTSKNTSAIQPLSQSIVTPTINVELSDELKDHNVSIPYTPTTPSSIYTITTPPFTPIHTTPLDSLIQNNNEMPYGCLKNGSKPTFRTWKRQTVKNTNLSPSLVIEEPIEKLYPSLRERKLKEMKNKMKTENVKCNIIDPNKKYIKQKYLTRKYKLGKHSDNTISILIKNRHTRRKIAHECTLLKKKSILEIKNYLRKRNLLKAGSEAPNDVLRKLYEQSILTGDVYNTSGDVLMHNFMNADEK